MAHINPCPNPNIPPVSIELYDIPCNESHEQYPNAIRAVKAYWRQATNMTFEDQIEYKGIVEYMFTFEQEPLLWRSKCSSLYKSCKASPTWAKYVFIKAMYGGAKIHNLDAQVLGIFKSLKIEDFERDYRTHIPDPARVKEGTPTEQFPPPAAQSSAKRSQPNAPPPLKWSSSPVMNQPVTQQDLERLETRLKEHIDDHIRKIRESIVAVFSERTAF
ncbi:hypothetical protein GGI43DRAFT_416390 [Trichoderma evansii]